MNATTVNTAVDTSLINAIFQASLVVQLTLLVLIGMSVLCWAVGIAKWKEFSALKKANPLFLASFWKATSFDALYNDLSSFPRSSMARVFQAGFLELQKLAQKNPQKNESIRLSGVDNFERALKQAVENEVSLMESKLSFLATTGSTGPFIGLFGTVWGILSSFHKIGATGSASLAVVAPGISEALFATAIGLAAAIPAVVIYNSFVTQLRKQEIQLNNFAADLLNIAERNFFQE